MMIRAVIYARYSSDMQRPASIDDQIRVCKEFVDRQGWELQQVYKDAALSGASSLRPGYQALLEGARNAEFDVIVAEALDRLSRDQEDIAGFYKRCRFAAVRITTLSEGEISELHVGMNGTMNAVFLKNLADKTRRGMRGCVEAGRSGGGVTYGYDVVPSLDLRGQRRINEDEAAVVRRIFAWYGDGLSPRSIALKLNSEEIPGPRGGKWAASTINGNRDRGTGVLNNQLYVGRLVWNRLRYSKDPDTGRRRSRANDEALLVTKDVPELRIVDQTLWEAARSRQAELDQKGRTSSDADASPAPSWTKNRPKTLLSGLLRCGVCEGGFSKISKMHFGCSAARNKGPTVCTNLLTMRQDRLESTVLDGLRGRLMDPAVYQVFVAAFTEEWNKMQSALAGDLSARRAEHVRIKAQLEKLVDALTAGTPIGAIKDRMCQLEDRRIELEAELETAVAPAPRLHPNLAVVYREKVGALTDALRATDGAAAMELVRSLIEEVRLVPDSGRSLRIELRGELASILGVANGARNANSPSGDAEALGLQVKMVAGIRFELMTFRL